MNTFDYLVDELYSCKIRLRLMKGVSCLVIAASSISLYFMNERLKKANQKSEDLKSELEMMYNLTEKGE